MTVLDAQALIAFLRDEPAADQVAALLADELDARVISAVNVAELIDVLVRGYHVLRSDVEEKLDWLIASGVEVVPADEEVGRIAGWLRAKEYQRVRPPLSLADCVALATAIVRQEPLATADRFLASVAERHGSPLVRLPSSAS